MDNLNPATALALSIWPLISIGLFAYLPLRQAIIWTILGGYLLLPVGAAIKFEGIPPFDKTTIPNLMALIGTIFVIGRFPTTFRRFSLADTLIAVSLFSPFITSLLNTDTLVIGGRVLPGVGPYDALSAAVAQFIFIIPFFLGRQLFASASDKEDIFKALVWAGLAYSVLMLIEIRLSPQLHTWVYGYFPHSFQQQMREGGFRPVVFLTHGLLTAFFMANCVAASTVLWRIADNTTQRNRLTGILGYLSIVLVLCKTVSALVYGFVLVILIRFFRPKTQMYCAVAFAIFVVGYPVLRSMELVPTQTFLEVAGLAGEERVQSLETRFTQEDQLLRRASQRFFFGWGRWGRGRVYDEETGRDISITDGYWIITFAQFGLVGFIAEFGLLALPIFQALSAFRFVRSARDRTILAAFSLILAVNLIDLLPNASLTPWTWLVAGSLLGWAEALKGRAAVPFSKNSVPVAIGKGHVP